MLDETDKAIITSFTEPIPADEFRSMRIEDCHEYIEYGYLKVVNERGNWRDLEITEKGTYYVRIWQKIERYQCDQTGLLDKIDALSEYFNATPDSVGAWDTYQYHADKYLLRALERIAYPVN